MKKTGSDRSVRIIGGKWRSRKVSFPDEPGLRPTPDRVRETLFNWLQDPVHGARTLEPFAGSGILSLEALSRGARNIVLIDQLESATRCIRSSLEKLGATPSQYSLIQDSAFRWMARKGHTPYDIIFLDPPFAAARLAEAVELIHGNNLLADRGWLYIESAERTSPHGLPAPWRIHRQKRAGRVHYCLVTTG